MFGPAISAFRTNINALRDFVDVIDPVLHEKTKVLLEERKESLAPLALIFVKDLELLGGSIRELVGTEDERFKQHSEVIERYCTEIERRCEELKVAVTIVEGADKRQSMRISGEGVNQFLEALQSYLKAYKRRDLLYESSLISLSSMAEWFLAALLHGYFETYSDAVGTGDKAFSLQDLREFGSIEDARKSLTDSTVENILRGSFEDWHKFLKERLKLNMGYLDMERLVEFFQRRNLLVHNAGIVNSIYINRVAAPLRKQCTVGEHIKVPADYLDDAIALVELNFLLIAAELWKKLEPGSQERSELLIEISFNHLIAERWEIAKGLSFFVKNDKQALESYRLKAQLNYWQALKWQDRFEEVRSEVEKVDFSAKDPLFRLALAALRDDLDNFFELLPDVLNSKKLSLDDLEIWPIFRTIRSIERYGLFIAQRKTLSPPETTPQEGERLP